MAATVMLDLPPAQGSSVTCTLGNGERVFLRTRQLTSGTAVSRTAADDARTGAGAGTSLLMRPIAEMVQLEYKNRLEREVADEDKAAVSSEADADAAAARVAGGSNELWVDKYRPTAFAQLLSNERVNREVLRWIKMWDPLCQPGASAAAGGAQAVRHSSPRKRGGAGGSRLPFGSPGAGAPPPAQKGVGPVRPDDDSLIMMLSGPPGTGKTTLAHIAARHAGYEPLEINASDDRSPKVLRERIITAMESRAIFGEQRPRCIILDEIDGAIGGGEAQGIGGVLLDLCRAPLHSAARAGGAGGAEGAGAGADSDDEGAGAGAEPGQGSGPGGKSKGKGKSAHALVCPIICICNDAYAPALRPLRPVARSWAFDHAQPTRLLERLKNVCREQRMNVNVTLLRALVEVTGHDVRACLHSLQFLRSFDGALTAELMEKIAIGKKDSQQGLFDLWGEVLLSRGNRARRKAGGDPGDGATFLRFSRALSQCNDRDRALQGLHHNVLAVRFSDPTMAKLNRVFDWLGHSDVWLARAGSQQQFALLSYLPSAVCAVRHQVGQRTLGGAKLAFPTRHAQLRGERQKRAHVLQAFVDARALLAGRDARGCALHVLSHFLCAISPVLREVNSTLLSAEERAAYDRLVTTMASCKVTFKPVYKPPAPPSFALEPPIDQLVDFAGQPAADAYPALGNETKQLVARDIARQAMRRLSAAVSGGGGAHAGGRPRQQAEAGAEAEAEAGVEDASRKRPADGDAPKASGSVFSLMPERGQSAATSKRQRSCGADMVVFKFQAGFTNAVRRPATMADFV
eukprot:g4894.t1